MKQDKLKTISAKDLGKLNLSDFCPRCFWIERNISKPPSIFPGIFSTLDALTKRSVHRSFAERGKSPDWLPIDNLVEVEEGDTYFKLPVGFDWVLTGYPDDIFRTKDGTYYIVDYKTAKFTARQDELFPLYEVQLNCYAYLAEKYGFKPISDLSLVYCQPNGDLDSDEEFKLGFSTHWVRVNLNLEIVERLLSQARDIVGLADPPEAAGKCKGICQWTNRALGRLLKQ
ncbi:PD-(D/E)XK nuclease family protein [Patescibacteria group bacterium]|nr:PD-(D/E)XK nuclease family protein [Patescibacteria group bacterium]